MASADLRDVQKGSAEMIVLSLLEGRARHGYELAKMIESQSDNRLQFHVASLYPMLYRLERKQLVEGKWVENPASAAAAITNSRPPDAAPSSRSAAPGANS